jgi:hypothetical protein
MQRLCTVPYKLYQPPHAPKHPPEISKQLLTLNAHNVTQKKKDPIGRIPIDRPRDIQIHTKVPKADTPKNISSQQWKFRHRNQNFQHWPLPQHPYQVFFFVGLKVSNNKKFKIYNEETFLRREFEYYDEPYDHENLGARIGVGGGRGIPYEYAEITLKASGDSQTNKAVLGLGGLVLYGASVSGLFTGGELAKVSTSTSSRARKRTSDLQSLLNPSSTTRRFEVVSKGLEDGTVFKEVSEDKRAESSEELKKANLPKITSKEEPNSHKDPLPKPANENLITPKVKEEPEVSENPFLIRDGPKRERHVIFSNRNSVFPAKDQIHSTANKLGIVNNIYKETPPSGTKNHRKRHAGATSGDRCKIWTSYVENEQIKKRRNRSEIAQGPG